MKTAYAAALKDQIVASLESGIFTGVFRPGERLVERALAVRFGVSPIPVREALQELEMRGLVVKKVNRGCSVIDLSPDAAVRACALRALLEPVVIAWAAKNLEPKQVAPLKARLRALATAAKRKDLATFFHQDMLLHKELWEIGGNEFATRALESALGPLFAVSLMRASEAKTLDLPGEVAKHTRLVDAVLARDQKKARQLASEIATTLESVSVADAAAAR